MVGTQAHGQVARQPQAHPPGLAVDDERADTGRPEQLGRLARPPDGVRPAGGTTVGDHDEQRPAAGAPITSIPTLRIFRAGFLVYSRPGALPGPALEQLIEGARNLDMEQVRAAAATDATDS